ncbi:hypothetical protein [Nisaea nitritireducens]|uniref:hypothetical protein n=1 Tax=Nisaea nitritireducens TaxID=568392 RepID=UPI001868EDAB|nr:hypothetical protein [Nisaea nitritireducens]
MPRARAARVLNSYTMRRSPGEAARASGTSLNTARRYYRLIRARLVSVGYYTETPLSLDDQGMAEETTAALKARRGIRGEDIPYHAAEVIEWMAEFPPHLVHKHIAKIIDRTGPLDAARHLNGPEAKRLRAYIRFARTELVLARVAAQTEADETQRPFLERIRAAKVKEWRAYRAACKRVERTRS